jgi:hypothetical protein
MHRVTKLQNSIIRSYVQNFKLTNETQITIFFSLDKHENASFFFFKNWDKVFVNVFKRPPYPQT